MGEMKKEGRVTTQVLFMAVCIAFAVGFMSGVVLTVYKMNDAPMEGGGQMSGADMDKMAQALEADLAANPGDVGKWTQLGNVYFDTGKYEKSIRAYEKSLELDPSNPAVITDMGIMYRRSGQFKKAAEVFERAISVDPQFEMAYLNKGIVLFYDLEDEAGALAVWERLLEINPIAMISKNQSLDALVRHIKDKHDEKQ